MDSTRQVAMTAEALLGSGLDGPPVPMVLGYGNENWRVDAAGASYLMKIIGPQVSADKATAASRAYRLAGTTVAPVPVEVVFDAHCGLLGGRMVRMLTFLPGEHPGVRLEAGASVPVFFESFGRAVGALHQARCDAFASRVGGSPSFTRWIDYVEYRVPQIVQRCRQTGGFTEAEIDRMFDRTLAAAREVSDLVDPRLCHRDLYLDNLLIGPAGRISGLLDLDLAEAWDCCVDFVKPRSQVFPRYPGAAEAFEQGYADAAGGLPPEADRRIRVAEVLELSNHVVNALAGGKPEYADHNRRRLQGVLDVDW